MNTNLYNGIVTRLQAKVPDLKTIKLFNDQFNHSNSDVNENNDEQAFLYPCCFLEFTDIEYTTATSLLQSYTGTLRLHIGFESYKNEDTDIFTLKQNIFKALQGFQVTTDKIYGKLIRLKETTDTEHNNIYIYIQEYQLSGKDADFSTENDKVEVAPPIAVEINANLDIDNIILRSGDGL
jgi:hypothetical protein